MVTCVVEGTHRETETKAEKEVEIETEIETWSSCLDNPGVTRPPPFLVIRNTVGWQLCAVLLQYVRADEIGTW